MTEAQVCSAGISEHPLHHDQVTPLTPMYGPAVSTSGIPRRRISQCIVPFDLEASIELPRHPPATGSRFMRTVNFDPFSSANNSFVASKVEKSL